jgi:hypothetical protein
MTQGPTPRDPAVARHPFAAAIAAGDHPALVATMHADVVLHSAVAATPFTGKQTVAQVYAGVLGSFDELAITDELATGETYVFYWRGRIGRRAVEGADRLRLDATGSVTEITVMARPLSGLATFLSEIGPRYAEQTRGWRVARALRATARPLPAAFAALEPLIGWLSRPSRTSGTPEPRGQRWA